MKWFTDSSNRRVWINPDNITHIIQPVSGENKSWIYLTNGQYIEILLHPTIIAGMLIGYQSYAPEAVDQKF